MYAHHSNNYQDKWMLYMTLIEEVKEGMRKEGNLLNESAIFL